MATTKRIIMTLSIAIVVTQSSAMKILGRYAIAALAKRPVVLRTSVTKIANPSLTLSIKTTSQPIRRPLSSFKYTPLKSTFNRVNTKKTMGIALGLASTALCAGQLEDKEKNAHKDSFEKSRKQFYANLQAKPWGQVAKKYIDELQAEEQKLMKEFFSITKMKPEEWDALLLKAYSEGNQDAIAYKINMENYFGPIPKSLQKELNDAAQNCSIDPQRLTYVESETLQGSHTMGVAYPYLIAINGRVILHYKKIKPWLDSYIHKFTMMHEMQHLLHHDWTLGKAVYSTYYKHMHGSLHELENPIFDDFSGRFSRMREKRADILALLSIHPNDHFVVAKTGAHILLNYPERDAHYSQENREFAAEVIRLHEEFKKGNEPKTKDRLITSSHHPIHERAAYLGRIRLEMLQAMSQNQKA